MPIIAVAKLSTRLINQETLTRKDEEDGRLESEAWLTTAATEFELLVPLRLLSELDAICVRSLIMISSRSGCKFGYDNATKAVTTAEKSPAYISGIRDGISDDRWAGEFSTVCGMDSRR